MNKVELQKVDDLLNRYKPIYFNSDERKTKILSTLEREAYINLENKLKIYLNANPEEDLGFDVDNMITIESPQNNISMSSILQAFYIKVTEQSFIYPSTNFSSINLMMMKKTPPEVAIEIMKCVDSFQVIKVNGMTNDDQKQTINTRVVPQFKTVKDLKNIITSGKESNFWAKEVKLKLSEKYEQGKITMVDYFNIINNYSEDKITEELINNGVFSNIGAKEIFENSFNIVKHNSKFELDSYMRNLSTEYPEWSVLSTETFDNRKPDITLIAQYEEQFTKKESSNESIISKI